MGMTAKNTDREIWREKPDDYYSNSIHVTEGNGIGMNVGGHVIVLRTEVWHEIAKKFISERAIAESQAWISVKEKLPAENERVLWWKVGEHEVDSVHLAEHPEDHFTHWMPLPTPPKG